MIKYKKDIAYQRLKADILTGRYPISFRLPTEKQLAQQEGVSFITIRSSLKMLEDDGLIQRIPGKGTFVISNTPARKTTQSNAKVALVMPDFQENPQGHFNCSLIYGASERIVLDGDTIEVADYKESWFDRYLNQELDGIIWDRPPEDFLPVIEQLRDSGCPQVIVNRPAIPGVPACLTDYCANIRSCMRYLHSIGHNRIGMIDLTPKYIHFFRKRHAAFCQELQSFGCTEPEKYLMLMDSWPQKEWWKYIRNWMRTVPDMTAVLCFEHSIAAFEQARKALQIRVPQDLSLIQIGEVGEYALENQTAHCIMTDPRRQVGKEAMKLIRAQRQGKALPEETLIRGELYIGRTCALPPELQMYLKTQQKMQQSK